MPNLEPGAQQKMNPISLRQSNLKNQKSATLRAITSILLYGEKEVSPIQILMIEENQIGNINLGKVLEYLNEIRIQEQENKPEGERKNLSLDDIYSQFIGNMKELGISNFIKTPAVREASDDIKLVSEIIINEELLLRLYKIAYEKQLQEINSRPDNHYSGKDTTSTEAALRRVKERLQGLEQTQKAA